jgi:hypothetical protein
MPLVRRRTPPADERARELERRAAELEARVAELEAVLDHERLHPALWADRRVRDGFGSTIVAGPFAGLAYRTGPLGAVDLLAPKLLGLYEQELHPAIEELVAARPGLVVDVGAAEGHYVVGLARRLPAARLVGFETREDQRSHLLHIAQHNGVGDRVDARGLADAAALAEVLVPGAWLVCDCEGGEVELLDPDRVPVLRDVAMVVEAHDLLVPRHDGDAVPALRGHPRRRGRARPPALRRRRAGAGLPAARDAAAGDLRVPQRADGLARPAAAGLRRTRQLASPPAMRIAIVSREVAPFVGGRHRPVRDRASRGRSPPVAEVTILTSDQHEERLAELRAAGHPSLPPASVRIAFAPTTRFPDEVGRTTPSCTPTARTCTAG